MHAPDVLYVVHDCWLSGKPMKRREFIWLLGGAALVPDSKGYTLRQKFFDVIHIAALPLPVGAYDPHCPSAPSCIPARSSWGNAPKGAFHDGPSTTVYLR